jgi:hypothetical protein
LILILKIKKPANVNMNEERDIKTPAGAGVEDKREMCDQFPERIEVAATFRLLTIDGGQTLDVELPLPK